MKDHQYDIEYFGEYPAPLLEKICDDHYTNINQTITFFGPMLYFFARAIGAEQILEIGHAEGYSAYYLANAVKDNATRFGMNGNRYYGIDIIQTERVSEWMKSKSLPAVIQNIDSMTLSKDTFPGVVFDIIFQDGNHDTEHVVYEFETMWPQLKGNGQGYFIQHDVYGPAEEGCRIIKERIDKGEFKAEYLRIDNPYGLCIIRKMDGYDYEKRHWWESSVQSSG